MKKVLFIMPQYELGGITVSLYSLLSKIDPKRIQADVFAAPTGPYKDKMPNCRELPENIWLSYPMIHGNWFTKCFQTVVYGLRYLLSKIHINTFPLLYWIGGKSLHTDKYDAVVCFSEGMAYMVSCLPAKKKIQWIHCDYRRHLASNNPVFERYAYQRYDIVVTVSEYVKNVFSEIYPEFANKVIAIHNVINVDDIQAKAKETDNLDERFKTDAFTIVSCGRLDPVKQFNKIPEIAAQVRTKTDKAFRWYIIGGGFPDEQVVIESEIKRNKLEETVMLLGQKTNVYPYISKANLFVCTSKSEAFSLVVNEAKALGVAVISNDLPAIHETIIDGTDGYITNIDDMPQKIVSFMQSPMKTTYNCIENNTLLDALYKLFEA